MLRAHRRPAAPPPAERFENPAFGGAWAGYNPDAQGASLYPNEVSSDFAFLPFGARAGGADTQACVLCCGVLRCAALPPAGSLLTKSQLGRWRGHLTLQPRASS